MGLCALVLLSVVVCLVQADDYCQAPLPKYYPAPHKLVAVQVVTRHGDRSPVNLLPFEQGQWNCDSQEGGFLRTTFLNDFGFHLLQTDEMPNIPYSKRFWKGNCYVGQLTTRGAQQHYQMGQAFRSIYIRNGENSFNLLPSTLYPDYIYVRSTYVPRTIESASMNIQGLYPLDKRVGPGSKIHTAPYYIENMVPNSELCPNISYVTQKLMSSTIWKTRQQKLQGLRERLNAICSTSGLSAWEKSFDHFADNFHARTCHGMPLPCSATNSSFCVSPSDAQQVFEQAGWEKEYLSGDALPQLALGSFFNDLLHNFNNAINQSTKVEFFFHSGHDDTLTYLLTGLGIVGYGWPPYASHLVLELFQDENGKDFYVRVLYNGQTQQLPFCGGDSFCPWESFQKYIFLNVSLTKDNYEKLCFPQA